MTRIWFNHWFSTSYGLIEMLKSDSELDAYVIASNMQRDSVIQKVCDEWYDESLAEGEDYVRDCITFCKEHSVDVFVPRNQMVEISKNKALFHEIGVKVLVDEYDIIDLLNNKAETYDYFKKIGGINIPEYEVVTDAAMFEKAYKSLQKNHDKLCVKFVNDEGAKSFRRIVEEIDIFAGLKNYRRMDVTYEEYLRALKTVDSFDELMIMPYMPGPEISVDCLKTASGLIAVPRIKSESRHENIVFDEEILRQTQVVMEHVQLECPCNVQFRMENGMPYLLEINTRMSGGLQMSCLAKEINIPAIAIHKLLGRDMAWSMDITPRVVSHIEIPKVIR